jgi:hypothetical protein
MSQLVSEPYKYNMTLTAIFSKKTMVRIYVDVYIRTIVVLTDGKLTRIYFLQFTLCNDAPTPR